MQQRFFLDQVASKLGLRRPEDWYTTTANTVLQMGGSFIKNQYRGSLIKGNLS
jgi:hypothetical protein